MKRLKEFLAKQESMEDKFFATVLIIGFIVVILSVAFTFVENIGELATYSTAGIGVFLLFVAFVAYRLKQITAAKTILVYILNLVLIPILFFTCGGVHSGMPLYCLATAYVIVPMLNGKQKVVAFVVTAIYHTLMMLFSYHYMVPDDDPIHLSPDYLKDMTVKATVEDMAISYFFVAIFIFATVSIIFYAYKSEQKRTNELLEQLKQTSTHDALTKVFNRGELFKKMEAAFETTKKNYYLLMIDIDNFKKINDTYGHLFGDKALVTIAGLMDTDADQKSGEIVGRYGGEEFVFVYRDISDDSAEKRARTLRHKIADTRYDEYPDLSITISGGLIKADEYDSLSEMLQMADQLLYYSKGHGKNQVTFDQKIKAQL